MQPSDPIPVKLFCGALFSDEGCLQRAMNGCEMHFGPVDLDSVAVPFDVTTYYEAEMGAPLRRRFFAFQPLASPDRLAAAKLLTNAIEQNLATGGRRCVNLDIGYLDYDKVVLASAKYGIHKIFIGQGIYADLALHYEKGHYQPYPWAFMDFKRPTYHRFFLQLRGIYKKQLHRLTAGAETPPADHR